ncbi:hypothetical protein HOP50_03g22300 [Chloropicon primus]|uniref:Uncharacterized protein n=2 Tax=Chloropicon primus TaxID=1764295 RepID=A0A5B8MH09_9CHLO|nr:hypothetical protein A3770_03p22310 [Chloropicon primus]UPQ98924.1 hypothetical protein HOP50_03g22300 [Chloropicon primus]|eukprot:QDZ19713.1 hypothetical protein A3770_03p22310 [Chloropicon primus]
MKSSLITLSVLAALCGSLAASASPASAPGVLSESSPLYAQLQQAKDAFACEGGDCVFKLSDQTGPDGTCVTPKMPRIPGNRNPTMEEFCNYHQSNPAEQWEMPFRASQPLSTTVPNGKLVGCIVGNNLFAQEARLLPGWQGKGYNATTGVFTNLVQLGLLDDPNAYPGKFYPDYDPVDGVSWKLDYSVGSTVPIIGPVYNFVMDRLMPGRYIRNMGGFEDHMRELAPGIWMGQVYALPYMLSWDLALGNPTPFMINVGVPFILFQKCE